MKPKKNFSRGRALIIVAHPDDETIWSGGLIRRYPEINWTIFSLCRASDPDRLPKFLLACRHFKAQPLIADLPDDGKLNSEQLQPLIMELILKQFRQPSQFDLIFTHGENGEYGHPAHQAAHLAVMALYQENKLRTKTLFCFNYGKGRRPTARPDSDLILRLNAKEFKNKKAVMTEIYGFTPDGIDTNYCTNPEAFKIVKK